MISFQLDDGIRTVVGERGGCSLVVKSSELESPEPLQSPTVLIFDEATSALDKTTEDAV